MPPEGDGSASNCSIPLQIRHYVHNAHHSTAKSGLNISTMDIFIVGATLAVALHRAEASPAATFYGVIQVYLVWDHVL